MTWERVYTVNDFYDGPRLGIADFQEKPHIYESRFNDEIDDYEDKYALMPVDQKLFTLVLEDWQIYIRWREEYERVLASATTAPAEWRRCCRRYAPAQ